MAANAKPNVDWNQIRQWYAEGANVSECARRSTEAGVPISRQAVDKRCKREGWKVAASTPATIETEYLQTAPEANRRVEVWGRRTAENLATIIARLKQGQSEATAIAGLMSQPTWIEWKKADPEAAELVDAAKREYLGTVEIVADEAIKRGDTRTMLRRLETHPLTKKEWAAPAPQRTDVQISLVVNDMIKAISDGAFSQRTIEGQAEGVEPDSFGGAITKEPEY